MTLTGKQINMSFQPLTSPVGNFNHFEISMVTNLEQPICALCYRHCLYIATKMAPHFLNTNQPEFPLSHIIPALLLLQMVVGIMLFMVYLPLNCHIQFHVTKQNSPCLKLLTW